MLQWLTVLLLASPTFYKDVAPILQNHCQTCHRTGQIGPMPLVTYADARKWSANIARRTAKHEMPPWFADSTGYKLANDPSLTAREIEILADWAAAGAPAGNAADAPKPPAFTTGWSIPQPDAILKMPKPVPIPARGTIDYTFEIVPTNFTEDKWIAMSEIRPSLRANVHHAVVYIRPPGSPWLRDKPLNQPFTAMEDQTTADILLVYAPGSSPDQFPENIAKLIPKGSDLVFQLHYTTNGHPGVDQTSIGLVFAKQKPANRVLTLQLTNSHFSIPPRMANYRVEARGTLPNDAILLSFLPHLHLRGKEFTYNIVHREPGKPPRLEPLLHVNYNFFWQLSYRLATPLALKAGTELQAVAIFDNSKANTHNPDPNATVVWGDQTSDEMMVGFFDVAVPAATTKSEYFDRSPAK